MCRALTLSAIVSPGVPDSASSGRAFLIFDPSGLPLPLEVACLEIPWSLAEADVGKAMGSTRGGFRDNASALTFNHPGLCKNWY